MATSIECESEKISVIIPIYNVELYLRECVDSVLAQSYTNLEVILVDDGSPDGSPAICDEYAAQDPRVKTLHKENGGLSDARNFGLREASGEYVIFLDSDDYWGDTDAMSKLMEASCEGVDMLYFKCQYVGEKGAYTKPSFDASRINSHSKVEALKYLISTDNFVVTAWSKLVRRALLTDHNIEFQKGLLSEDYDWTFAVVTRAKNIRAVDIDFYCYRLREGSIMTNVSTKHLFDIWSIITNWYDRIPREVANREEAELYIDFLGFMYGSLMSRLYRSKEPSRRNQLIAEMKPYAHTLINRNRSGKLKKVAKLYKLLGFNLTWRVLGLHNKHITLRQG